MNENMNENTEEVKIYKAKIFTQGTPERIIDFLQKIINQMDEIVGGIVKNEEGVYKRATIDNMHPYYGKYIFKNI